MLFVFVVYLLGAFGEINGCSSKVEIIVDPVSISARPYSPVEFSCVARNADDIYFFVNGIFVSHENVTGFTLHGTERIGNNLKRRITGIADPACNNTIIQCKAVNYLDVNIYDESSIALLFVEAESASGASGTQDISLQSDIPIIDPSLPMSSGKMYYASSLNIVHVEELVDSSFTMFKYKLSDGKTIQTSPSMKTDGSDSSFPIRSTDMPSTPTNSNTPTNSSAPTPPTESNSLLIVVVFGVIVGIFGIPIIAVICVRLYLKKNSYPVLPINAIVHNNDDIPLQVIHVAQHDSHSFEDQDPTTNVETIYQRPMDTTDKRQDSSRWSMSS